MPLDATDLLEQGGDSRRGRAEWSFLSRDLAYLYEQGERLSARPSTLSEAVTSDAAGLLDVAASRRGRALVQGCDF